MPLGDSLLHLKNKGTQRQNPKAGPEPKCPLPGLVLIPQLTLYDLENPGKFVQGFCNVLLSHSGTLFLFIPSLVM